MSSSRLLNLVILSPVCVLTICIPQHTKTKPIQYHGNLTAALIHQFISHHSTATKEQLAAAIPFDQDVQEVLHHIDTQGKFMFRVCVSILMLAIAANLGSYFCALVPPRRGRRASQARGQSFVRMPPSLRKTCIV